MKKFICAGTLAMAVLLSAGTASYARTGDVVGHIYTTDIYAYMNDIPVSSYNIGGKTAVILEDVTKYHSYDNNTRTLTVSSLDYDNIVSGALVSYGTLGIEIGNIYETDIKTYVCGKQVTAYNIGGKTAVALEDLGGYNSYSDIGCKYNWNDSTRTIRFETRITIEDDYGSDYEWHSVWESDDDDDWYDDDDNWYDNDNDDDSSWYDDDDDDDGDDSGWYDDGPQYLLDVCPPYEMDAMNDDSFYMAGERYSNGLQAWFYDYGCAYFNLNGKYSKLNCIIGHVDGWTGRDKTVKFYVDGKQVKVVQVLAGEMPKEVSVSLNYGKQLKIQTDVGNQDPTVGIAEITVE